MSEKKVYGLIIPKKPGQESKKAPAPAAAFNIFGDDEDSDEEEKTKGPIGPFGCTKTNAKLKLQNQMDIEKAMMEDPSVYEYDEIYDDIQASKPQPGKPEEMKIKKTKKAQYIGGLLKAAEEKKKENERRNERKVQKEREAEGEKYADKEAFVTSAYKQKMLERQQEEEEERRKEELEAMTDVTKQKDLGGFYRYLYRQTTGPEDGTQEVKVTSGKKDDRVKEESLDHVKEKKQPSTKSVRQKYSSSSSSSAPSDSENSESRNKLKGKSQFHKRKEDNASRRNFRKRHADSSSDDDGEYNKHGKDGKKGRKDGQTSEERDTHKKWVHQPKHSGSSNYDRQSASPLSRKKIQDSSPDFREKTKTNDERKRRLSPSTSPPRSRGNSPIHRRRSRSNLRSQGQEEYMADGKRKSHGHSGEISDSRTEERRKRDHGRLDQYGGEDKQDRKRDARNGRHDRTTPGDSEIITGPMEDDEKATAKNKGKTVPVDPKDKVYPHHNSPKDIAEARKRYLIRKLEREKARGS